MNNKDKLQKIESLFNKYDGQLAPVKNNEEIKVVETEEQTDSTTESEE